MPARAWSIIVATLVIAGCGTSDVTLRDEGVSVTTAPSSTAPSTTSATGPTTTSTTTTSTTTTTTTSTTTTTTSPPVPLQFDDEGVPVNGQTSGVLVTANGHITPVLGSTADGGWRVWSPCGIEIELDTGELIETVDVVLDPGHGGSEPGAVAASGLRESDLNLAVAERAATALRAAGYSVVMTRDRDERVPIVTRAEIALALEPLAFVSIHHNGGVDAPSTAPGTEMYHQVDDPTSKRLAGLMLEEARAVLDAHDVPWVSMSDAGAMARLNREGGDYYGVLRRASGVPSVLAEFAYLSNGPEAELLADPAVQDDLARSIVTAIDRLTGTDDPGSGFTEDPIFRGYGPSGAGRTEGCVDPELE